MSKEGEHEDKERDERAAQLYRRVADRLRRLVEREHTQSELSRSLDRPDSWMNRILRGELLPRLPAIRPVVDFLRLSLRWFLSWTFEDQDDPPPQRILQVLRIGPDHELDPFLKEIGPAIRALMDDETEPEDLRSMPEDLEEIDDLRFTDRPTAKERAEATITGWLEAEPTPESKSRTALGLGVWASIQRTNDRHRDAMEALTTALELIDGYSAPWIYGILLQRSAYLLRDWCEYHEAVRFIEQSMLTMVRLQSFRDIGRLSIDRALLASDLKDYQTTRIYANAALRYLPEEAWRSLVAAHQYLSDAHLMTGNHSEALAELELAISYYRDPADPWIGNLIWSKGRISFSIGDIREAETCWETALELTMAGSCAGDTALVAMDLAKALLIQGKDDELEALARQMMAFTSTIDDGAGTESILLRFANRVLYERSGLTTDFLDLSIEKLKAFEKGAAGCRPAA